MRSFRQVLSASAIVALTLAATGCSSPDDRPADCPYPPLPTPLHEFCRNPQPGTYRVTEGPFCDVIIADDKSVRLAYYCGGELTRSERQATYLAQLPDAEALNALANGVPEADVIKKFGKPPVVETCEYVRAIAPFAGLYQTHYPDEKRAEYEFFSPNKNGDIDRLTLHIMYPRDGAGKPSCRVEWRMNGHKTSAQSLGAK